MQTIIELLVKVLFERGFGTNTGVDMKALGQSCGKEDLVNSAMLDIGLYCNVLTAGFENVKYAEGVAFRCEFRWTKGYLGFNVCITSLRTFFKGYHCHTCITCLHVEDGLPIQILAF